MSTLREAVSRPASPRDDAGRSFVFGSVAAHDVALPADVDVRVEVPASLRWLEGHFPGDPIVPGIAQLLPLVAGAARRAFPDIGVPRGCSRVKFHHRIDPGEALRVSLAWTPEGARGQGVVRFRISTEPGDSLRTTGYLRFEPGETWSA